MTKIQQLQDLIKLGITQKAELARRLNVSRPTLYAILKKLKEQGIDVLTLAPVVTAPLVEPRGPGRPTGPTPRKPKTKKETRDELKQFARLIDRQVNIVEQLNSINETAQQTLDQVVEAAKSDQKLAGLVFKGCAEIRSQLEFASELIKMVADAQAVQEFQEEVLEVIQHVNSDIRKEIERRLAERRALRGAVSLPSASSV